MSTVRSYSYFIKFSLSMIFLTKKNSCQAAFKGTMKPKEWTGRTMLFCTYNIQVLTTSNKAENSNISQCHVLCGVKLLTLDSNTTAKSSCLQIDVHSRLSWVSYISITWGRKSCTTIYIIYVGNSDWLVGIFYPVLLLCEPLTSRRAGWRISPLSSE